MNPLAENPEHFSQVNYFHLIPNTKYMVTDLYGVYYYTGTFICYDTSTSSDIASFKNVMGLTPVKRPCGYVNFSYSIGRKFYEFVSKKKEIQESMEARALIMIIQNIIGDKCFKY
jgi:hypothetical protein